MHNSNHPVYTVNSSPYAVPVYHKLGFIDMDSEQLSDGIRFTPMKFERYRDNVEYRIDDKMLNASVFLTFVNQVCRETMI